MVVAVHDGSEEVVAVTTVSLWPGHPVGRQQYTRVRRHHRGRRLGLRVKAEMALRLADQEPALTTLQTWNDVGNAPVLAMNRRLGWRGTGTWTTYEGSLASL